MMRRDILDRLAAILVDNLKSLCVSGDIYPDEIAKDDVELVRGKNRGYLVWYAAVANHQRRRLTISVECRADLVGATEEELGDFTRKLHEDLRGKLTELA